MGQKFKISAIAFSLLATLALFIFSCFITLTDGQGAIFFAFALPVIALFLLISYLLAKRMGNRALLLSTQALGIFIGLFVALSPIPALNAVPGAVLSGVGKTFEYFTGKSPYAFMKERNNLENSLRRHLEKFPTPNLNLGQLPVTFAWDRVCFFPPYTNGAEAKKVLGLDWNLEEYSQIKFSDSVNALVFLYEGRVNKTADLPRRLAEFGALGGHCFARREAIFTGTRNAEGRLVFQPAPSERQTN